MHPAHRKRQWRGLIAAAAYTLLLTYLLLAPQPLNVFGEAGLRAEDALDRTIADDVQHMVAYGLLGYLLARASSGAQPVTQHVCFWFCLAHAIGVEWLQVFVPARYFHWEDTEANVIGLVAGWLVPLYASRTDS